MHVHVCICSDYDQWCALVTPINQILRYVCHDSQVLENFTAIAWKNGNSSPFLGGVVLVKGIHHSTTYLPASLSNLCLLLVRATNNAFVWKPPICLFFLGRSLINMYVCASPGHIPGQPCGSEGTPSGQDWVSHKHTMSCQFFFF